MPLTKPYIIRVFELKLTAAPSNTKYEKLKIITNFNSARNNSYLIYKYEVGKQTDIQLY